MNGNLRTPSDVEEALRFMERSIIRLKRSFRLEKEEALASGLEKLYELRERSRSHYQPIVMRMHIDLYRLRYRMVKVKQVPSGIFLRLDDLDRAIKEVHAHFSGVPSRLLRSAGQNTGDDDA